MQFTDNSIESFDDFVSKASVLISGQDSSIETLWDTAVQAMIDKFASSNEEDSFANQASNVYEKIIEAQQQYNAEVAALDLTDTVTDMQKWAEASKSIA
jgi:hypothetical protein